MIQEKQLQKKITLLLGWTNYFPVSFWCLLSVLLPYREEISPCLWNLAAIAVLIEDALKLSFEGKTNYFYQLPSETTPEWERTFMDVWSKILRYQVVLMENPELTISPSEVLNPTTLLPTPEGSPLLLLPRNLGPMDKTLRGIVRRYLRKSGILMEAALSWMDKEEPDMQQSPVLRS